MWVIIEMVNGRTNARIGTREEFETRAKALWLKLKGDYASNVDGSHTLAFVQVNENKTRPYATIEEVPVGKIVWLEFKGKVSVSLITAAVIENGNELYIYLGGRGKFKPEVLAEHGFLEDHTRCVIKEN